MGDAQSSPASSSSQVAHLSSPKLLVHTAIASLATATTLPALSVTACLQHLHAFLLPQRNSAKCYVHQAP